VALKASFSRRFAMQFPPELTWEFIFDIKDLEKQIPCKRDAEAFEAGE
jgi:hypothetical protein